MAKWNTQSTHTDVAAFSDDPRVQKLVRLHRIRVIIIVAVVCAIVGFGAKPAYNWFRETQINRNLEAAKTAARVQDWGLARNKARSVLLARPTDFEAYRIWHKALAEMGEPRTYMVAANLFMDPRSTHEDRMDALRVLALQAPQAVALSAYASLDQEAQAAIEVRTAIAPLLLKRGEIALAEKLLRESPGLKSQPGARLELLAALCATPTAERVAEARTIFASLVKDDLSELALQALQILGDTPGGLAPGTPLPRISEWIELQPKATTLQRLLALHPSIEALPEASETLFQNAIDRFLSTDPGTLGTWLIRHGKSKRAADALTEAAKTSPSAYIARLHALLLEKDSEAIAAALKVPPASADLVELELVKAALARMQGDSAAETNAWNQALNNAAYDQSRNRFIEIGKYAGTLGATSVIDDSWVAAVRIGWGQIPLYRDLLPVFGSLAIQGRSDDLFAMYRTLLRFEHLNPELINNYNYLALLLDVVSPASAAKTQQELIAANPNVPELHSALAMALLMDGKPDEALKELPVLRTTKGVSPMMCRAIESVALLLKGDSAGGRALLEGINWKTFMRCESLAFRQILTEIEIKDLPLPEMTQIQPVIDPEQIPAWKKAVERLEKERASDVLPPLPAPRIPGGE